MIDFFEKLRKNKKYHLGLGDIRLTIAQQDEISKLYDKLLLENIRLEEELSRSESYCEWGKCYNDIGYPIFIGCKQSYTSNTFKYCPDCGKIINRKE